MVIYHIRRISTADATALMQEMDATREEILAHFDARHLRTHNGYHYFAIARPKTAAGLPGEFFTDSYPTLIRDFPAARDALLECEYEDTELVDGEPTTVRKRIAIKDKPVGKVALSTDLRPMVFAGMRDDV